MNREDRIKELMETFGLSRTDAEEAVDFEEGETDGDVIEEDPGDS
jgi:ribosome assembly protein YihI (activator of Der GTPase)